MKLAIVNQKGGVGKSTVAINIAYCLASMGKLTILIDFESQANSTSIYLGNIDNENSVNMIFKNKSFDITKIIFPAQDSKGKIIDNLFIIPSNIHLAITSEAATARPFREKILDKHLGKIQDKVDFILIDCPPSLGILSINAIYTADKIIIPVNYDRFSLDGLADIFDVLTEVKESDDIDFRIIRTMKQASAKKTNNPVEKALSIYKKQLFKTVIRRAEIVNQSLMVGSPVISYKPSALVCRDFENLAEEIIAYV